MPCFAQLYEELGLKQTDIGFWCSGSSDYLAGRAFSFISAIDSIGAVPPINESHVEMDAAWALYEAYIKTADRPGRHRAGLRLRQIRRRARCAGCWPCRPTRTPSRRCGRIRCRWPDCRRDSVWTRASGRPSRWRRWRWTRWPPPDAPTRRNPPRASTNCWPGRTSPTRCAATTSRRSPTVPRRSCWPPATEPANCARTPPGSPASSTASRPRCSARAI